MKLKRNDMLSCLRWLSEAGATENICDAPKNLLLSNTMSEDTDITCLTGNIEFDKKDAGKKNIENHEFHTLTKLRQIDLAYKFAEQSETFESLVENMKKFPYFTNDVNIDWSQFFKGSIYSEVVVFREPETQIPRTKDHRNLVESKELLFVKIFKSIGLEVNNTDANLLCTVSILPWQSTGNIGSNSKNIEFVWPFLLRLIIILNPKILVFMGNDFLERYNEIESLKSEKKVNGRLRIFTFPSLDVLLRAPKRKRAVWDQLLTFKDILSVQEK